MIKSRVVRLPVMVLLYLLFGCVQEVGNDIRRYDCFYARVEQEGDVTRAHFEESAVKWEVNDKISVYSDIQTRPIFFTRNASGTFTNSSGISGDIFYAFYPTTGERPSSSENYVTFSIPGPAFDRNSVSIPMVARGGSNNLTFTQTCGVLHFFITGTGSYDKVTLRSNNGEYITGHGQIDLSSSSPSFSITGNGSAFISATVPSGSNWKNGVDVYFIVPPAVLTGGFTVTIENSAGNVVLSKRTDKSITISRKKMIRYTVNLDELRPKVESVTMSPPTLTLTEGQSETLKATANPEQADQSFTWSSNNTSVATVDSNGKVTAVKAGTADITATSKSNTAKKATCIVTVTSKTIPVTTVTVIPEELTLLVGEMAQIYATVLPSNATNRATKWSSNSSAVSVNRGLVTARQIGSALVMCTSEDNPKAMGTCRVTVVPPPVAVTSITLNKTSMTLSYGGAATLEANISPSDASDKTVQWSSSDTSVATVSENGRVMAQHKTGTATITAKSTNYPDVTATCTVTVKSSIVNVTGISIDPRSLSLYVGQTKKIVATVSPSNADDKTVIWEAAGGAVVTVDQQGNVKGLKSGYTTVTAFTSGKEYQTTARINVTINEMTGIQLNHPNGIVLKVGEAFDLTATPVAADPDADPSYPNISWSSGDKTVATVDNGHIVALKPGQITITVVSVYNTRIKATCPVTVLPAGASGGGSEGVGFDDWDF